MPRDCLLFCLHFLDFLFVPLLFFQLSMLYILCENVSLQDNLNILKNRSTNISVINK